MPTTPDRNAGSDRSEQSRHGEARECGDGRKRKCGTNLWRYRKSLQPKASRALRCFWYDKDSHRGQHDQPDVHDEGQMKRLWRVLDQ